MSDGCTTYSFCGTLDYMAPEIILNSGHGKAVDWWSLGVLMYYVMISYPPFQSKCRNKTMQKILNKKLSFPSHISKNATDLMGKLMRRSVNQRLGSGPDDAEPIKEHPFFQEINWDDLYAKKVTPPYIPTLSSFEDVSHFDSVYTSQSPLDSSDDLTLSSNDPFEGFSYEASDSDEFAVSNVLSTLDWNFSFEESFSPKFYSSPVLQTSMQQQVPFFFNDSDLSRIPTSSIYNSSPLEYFRLNEAKFWHA